MRDRLAWGAFFFVAVVVVVAHHHLGVHEYGAFGSLEPSI
jgi:hypothetical protein